MRRIIEFRLYALQIGSALKYINATRQNASLRKELFPLRLFSLPETGGQLNLATHLYSRHICTNLGLLLTSYSRRVT